MNKKDLKSLSLRFERVLSYYKLTPFSFSQRIGDKRSEKIRRVLDGDGAPSFDMIHRIKLHFPQVNLNWLFTGSGDMIKEDAPLQSNQKIIVKENARSNLIPFVAALESQTYYKKCKDPLYVADLPVLDDELYNDGVYRDFEVFSDVADPITKKGDVIRGRYVDHFDHSIHHPDRLYILAFPTGLFLRRVRVKKDHIELVPVNKEYQTKKVKLEDLIEFWRVVEIRTDKGLK